MGLAGLERLTALRMRPKAGLLGVWRSRTRALLHENRDLPADLTPAEVTILGLLVEQPRDGYQLPGVITERGMRDSTEIGFSSIYYLLAKLSDRGLAEEVEAQPADYRGAK